MAERKGAASRKESLRCRDALSGGEVTLLGRSCGQKGVSRRAQGLTGLKLRFHFPYPLLSGAVRVQLKLVAELARSCPSLVTIRPPLGLNAGWES